MSGIKLVARQAGVESAKNIFGGAKVKTSKVYTGTSNYEENIPDDYINVVLGIFMDGTLNNRKNVQSRIAHEKKLRGEKHDEDAAAKFIADKDEDTSYYNDESNISKTEPFYNEYSEEKIIQTKIYIEGIGTEDYEKDKMMGYAFGMGSTGIRKKVLKACEKAVEKIQEKTKDKIYQLTIDIYGFSRGAAAARNFVYEVTQRKGQIKAVITAGNMNPTIIKYEVDFGSLGEYLLKNGIEVKMLSIRFVGLYDTVASYGVYYKFNTLELHLDAIRKARYVFQLAAADEHREKFSLTNIKSAAGKGVEKYLPGVHSDIGGGYKDYSDETVRLESSMWLNTLRKERRRLIEEGWYDENEITIDRFWGYLIGIRKGLRNTYSFIPLQIMSEYSQKKKVDIKVNKIKRKYSIDNDNLLVKVKKRLDDYITGSREKLDINSTDPTDRELVKALRHKYFHFSANYKGIGMDPNIKNGKRKRIIQEG